MWQTLSSLQYHYGIILRFSLLQKAAKEQVKINFIPSIFSVICKKLLVSGEGPPVYQTRVQLHLWHALHENVNRLSTHEDNALVIA